MIPFSFARLGFGLEGRKALNPEQWICNIVSDQGRPRAARAVMSHSFLRPLLVLDYEWSCVLSVLKVLLLQNHRECNLSLFGRQLMGKVQCDPQLFSQHSFVVCELMKCAFLSKMHFCTFYHRDCIGLHNFCDSCELSRHPLCWRQKHNFHIQMPYFHQHTLSCENSYYCRELSDHDVCS